MRVSCSCPVDLASETLVTELKDLGLEPIVTNEVVRVVYEGPKRTLGETIVDIFAREANHEITVEYSDAEQRRSARKAMRKAEKAAWNVRLHGH